MVNTMVTHTLIRQANKVSGKSTLGADNSIRPDPNGCSNIQSILCSPVEEYEIPAMGAATATCAGAAAAYRTGAGAWRRAGACAGAATNGAATT